MNNAESVMDKIRGGLAAWKDVIYILTFLAFAFSIYQNLVNEIKEIQLLIKIHQNNPEIHQTYESKQNAFITRREFDVFTQIIKDDIKEIKMMIERADNRQRQIQNRSK